MADHTTDIPEVECEDCGSKFEVPPDFVENARQCRECYREKRIEEDKATVRDPDSHQEFVDALWALSELHDVLPVQTDGQEFIVKADVRNGDEDGEFPEERYIHRIEVETGHEGDCPECGFDRILKVSGLGVDDVLRKWCRHCGTVL